MNLPIRDVRNPVATGVNRTWREQHISVEDDPEQTFGCAGSPQP
jgi:hypothetical protein